MDQKQVSRRLYDEAWNKGDFAVVDEYMAADWQNHDPQAPALPPGPAGFKALAGGYRESFPDLRFTVDAMYEAGDATISRWMATGTQKAPFQGMPATGKTATVTGISINRWENGKIRESWGNWDTLGLLQQLGFVPKR